MADAYRQDGQLNIPTQAAADEIFKQKFGMSREELEAREGTIDNIPENSGGAARYAGQSFLFGFGDELEALFKTGQISGEEFKQARRSAVESANLYEANNPKKALAIDAAGFAPLVAGMIMSAPVSVPAAIGAAAIKGGQKFFQKIGPTKLGALAGLLHGAGSTEPTEGNFWQKTGNRLYGGSDDAVIAAAFAKALTKAAPPAIRFLSKIKSKLSFN